jgi:peptidyl-prolyl cis-trans isomerase D
VKSELTVQVRDDLAAEAFGQRLEELQSRIERGGASLAQLAQEFGMRSGQIERFERGAGGLPLGSDAELNREVFGDAALNQRRVVGPIAQGEDRLTIVQVMEHMPARVQPLEQVREEIVASVRRQRGTEAAVRAADAGLARLQAGESLDKVAASLKLAAAPSVFVGRQGVELPVELRDAVFAMPRPGAGVPQRRTMTMEDGSAALLEVLSVRPDSMFANAQLQALRAQQEQQAYGMAGINAYFAEVVKRAKVSKNAQAFTQ